MNAPRLPLPLELTSPALLAGDLDSQFQNDYDARTQLCSCTSSRMKCKSVNHLGVQVDVTVDVQVDDVLA
jgi:hypothetical protein